MMNQRWTEYPFPPYSYVTGKFPHPLRDAAGHGCAGPDSPDKPPTAEDWDQCQAYLWAFDLFNAGFYWEAHESWEAVWHAAGRSGATADLQKALIKLAAAGVKAREGRVAGVQRHARRSVELTQAVHAEAGADLFLGVNLPKLVQLGVEVERDATSIVEAAKDVAAVVMPRLELCAKA